MNQQQASQLKERILKNVPAYHRLCRIKKSISNKYQTQKYFQATSKNCHVSVFYDLASQSWDVNIWPVSCKSQPHDKRKLIYTIGFSRIA